MASVQFRTAADVLKAFENIKCPAWSLWDGKRFMFKGTGADELESFLDLMNENGASNAVYSLAYYDKETIPTAAKINSKTPFDGSFNFRLNSDEMELNTGQYRDFQRQSALVSKVNGLETKFDKLLEIMASQQAIEQPEENRLGIVGEILQHPAIAPILPGIIQTIADKFIGTGVQQPPAPPVQMYQPPARVAGIGNVLEQDQVLENAVSVLLQYDKKLADHLNKLALLAQRDPTTFNYIMQQLDQMKTE